MKRLRNPRLLLLLGLPIGLAVAGIFAYTQLVAGGEPLPVPDPAEGQHGPMMPLEGRVINLAVGGPYRYAKIGVTVELRPEDTAFYALKGEERATAEKEVVKAHAGALPLLLDALGTVVSARGSEELVTPEGRTALREELLAAMRRVLGEREVLDIYFTDLVMQ